MKEKVGWKALANVTGIDVGAALLRYAHGRAESMGAAVHFSQQDAEHTALGTGRRHARRRWDGKQAPVARAVTMVVNRQLSFEGQDRRGYQGFAFQHAGIVDEVARRKVVGAVRDQVVGRDDFPRIIARQRTGVFVDSDMRVQVAQALRAGRQLGLTDLAAAVKHLPVQVRNSDPVGVRDAERPDPSPGKILNDRRAQAPGAHNLNPRLRQLLLALGSHLWRIFISQFS